MLNKAYKFRLYPNHEQQVFINKIFGCTRFTYNHILSDAIECYQATNKLKYNTPASYKAEFDFLKEVDSLALANAQLNVQKAFKNFFTKQRKSGYERYTKRTLKKCAIQNRAPELRDANGFPSFKSKRDSYQSYTTNNQKNSIRIEANKIKLPKIGFVKLKLHQEVLGLIKSVTITKNPSGKYYISILTLQEIQTLEPIDKKLGVDLGLKDFAITSDGEIVSNLKFLRRSEKQLIKAQRALSRKQIGSNNRNKARLKVARLYEKIANQKRDFLHKLSIRFIRENQAIVIEDLSVKNMLQNRDLSKAISEASWYQFRLMLDYKSKWYGRDLIIADKHYASSQLCSCCGYKNSEVKNLGLRQWECPACHTHHDRDLNAAINLLKLA